MKTRLSIWYLNALADTPLHLARHFDWFGEEGFDPVFRCDIGWGALALRMQRDASILAAVPATFALALASNGAGMPGAPYAVRVLARRGVTVCARPWLAEIPADLPPKTLRFGFTSHFAPYASLFECWLRESGRAAWIPRVEVVPVAVSQILDFLAAGEIDVFCAMEPWGSHAEREGIGRVVGAPLLRGAEFPSQVLLCSKALQHAHAGLEAAIDRVLARSAAWLGDSVNLRSLPDLLGSRSWGLGPADFTRLVALGSDAADLPGKMRFPGEGGGAWFSDEDCAFATSHFRREFGRAPEGALVASSMEAALGRRAPLPQKAPVERMRGLAA